MVISLALSYAVWVLPPACERNKWQTYHRAYFFDEHFLRSVAVQTLGFVTSPRLRRFLRADFRAGAL